MRCADRSMKKPVILTVLLLAASTASANPVDFAGFMTDRSLQKVCLSSNRHDYGICLGYILGIADVGTQAELLAKISGDRSEGVAGSRWCIPTGTQANQVHAVVVNALREFQALRGEEATGFVEETLAYTWPCR